MTLKCSYSESILYCTLIFLKVLSSLFLKINVFILMTPFKVNGQCIMITNMNIIIGMHKYYFTDNDHGITSTPKKDSVPVLSVIEEALHSVRPTATSRSGNCIAGSMSIQ